MIYITSRFETSLTAGCIPKRERRSGARVAKSKQVWEYAPNQVWVVVLLHVTILVTIHVTTRYKKTKI